jgi:hypothetical protein
VPKLPKPPAQLNESLGLLPLDSPQQKPRDSHAFVATDRSLSGSPEAPRASLASVPQPQVRGSRWFSYSPGPGSSSHYSRHCFWLFSPAFRTPACSTASAPCHR